MRENLPILIALAGIGQLAVLVASAQVPLRLNWMAHLSSLPRLLRQLFWVYGGYVVLAIVGFGAISLLCAHELASGSSLALAVCAYMAVFWGIRLALTAVLDVQPYLSTVWLKLGYRALTIIFVALTAIYTLAALWPTAY